MREYSWDNYLVVQWVRMKVEMMVERSECKKVEPMESMLEAMKVAWRV